MQGLHHQILAAGEAENQRSLHSREPNKAPGCEGRVAFSAWEYS